MTTLAPAVRLSPVAPPGAPTVSVADPNGASPPSVGPPPVFAESSDGERVPSVEPAGSSLSLPGPATASFNAIEPSLVTNPFALFPLPVVIPPDWRVAGEPLGPEITLDPPWESLLRLVELESAQLGEPSAELAQIRLGMMLLTADAQDAREAWVPVPVGSLEVMAQDVLAANEEAVAEDFETFAIQQSAYLGAIQMDIHAFVERVLRECYLVQSEMLWDYSQRVQFYNELKKKMRDELSRARQYALTIGSASDSPASYTVVQFYGGTYLGDGTPFVDTGGGAAAETVEGGEDDTEESEPVEPVVTEVARDQIFHEAYYDNSESYGNFTKHGEDLISAILVRLPTDPEAQAALAAEWEQNGLEFGFLCGEWDGKDNWYFTKSDGALGTKGDSNLNDNSFDSLAHFSHADPKRTNESLADYVTRVVTDEVKKYKDAVKNAEGEIEIDSLDFRIKLPEYVVDYGDAPSPGAGTTNDGAAVAEWATGDVLSTRAEVDAYIGNLEESLNSVGDDAQLANIDLQNILQRQQETLKMMSNISKMVYDNTMDVIRRLGG